MIEINVKVNEKKLEILGSAIVSILQTAICKVRFEKADGTIREMKCTLKQDMLPPSKSPESHDNLTNINFLIIKVAEILANGDKAWRSFKVESLKSVEIVYE